MAQGNGPLAGVKVVLLGGIGPAPFCAALLSDLGADVVRIDRITATDGGLPVEPRFNLLNRGQRSIAMDLKKTEAIAAVMRLVAEADATLEGFRPGTAERLGIGPDACLAVNPRLVYGRMTGWGQDGPLAQEPGHDINYISLTGILHSIGREGEAPAIPLNIAGDFGGGSLYLAVGLLSGIIESRQSGKGQVVDAAMVDGSASLIALLYGIHAAGYWEDRRGVNRLDSGAPFYNVYETADGKYVSIGANEERFYANALNLLGLQDTNLPEQHDKSGWPLLKEKFAAAFKTKTRDEWAELALGKETCITPILSLSEVPHSPHIKARDTFVEVDGVVQPAPAPRFSRTPGKIQRAPAKPGQHSDEILTDWGFSDEEIAALRQANAVG